ncbi:hypothetical protein ACH36K_17730 [Clostridium sp. MB05]|jgi:hypothetical protein|uniref:Uncharacterized protein n=1 Tax=Clostridium perfringens TaxID=1502 RepID=A0AAW9K4E4_CLOPF|nr:hypothetical protein [Clostridium perfringens]MDZ5017135.1 hypothetical protein [Clostridium perfringens]MDZ7542624.1 hypothetical protein [Clostridium perfringens]
MYKVEINGVQMKFIREFFDNYEDNKVKLIVNDDSNRIKIVYSAETSLTANELEAYLKSEFKTKSKYGTTLYYTLNVK